MMKTAWMVAGDGRETEVMFEETYKKSVDEARKRLEELYDEKDYPEPRLAVREVEADVMTELEKAIVFGG